MSGPRKAAGLETQPEIRLHGCHRVGNLVTGLDPNSPEARQPPILIDVLPHGYPTLMMTGICEAIRRALYDLGFDA